MSRRWTKAAEAELLRRLGNVPVFKPSIVVVARPAHWENDWVFEGREELAATRLSELTGVEHVRDGAVVRPVPLASEV